MCMCEPRIGYMCGTHLKERGLPYKSRERCLAEYLAKSVDATLLEEYVEYRVRNNMLNDPPKFGPKT